LRDLAEERLDHHELRARTHLNWQPHWYGAASNRGIAPSCTETFRRLTPSTTRNQKRLFTRSAAPQSPHRAIRHLAKSELANQSPARSIFGKDARKQFPKTRLLRRLNQSFERYSASPAAAMGTRNIHRRFGDPGITRPRAVAGRGGERNHAIFILHHHDRMNTIEPGTYIFERTEPRLESSHAILNPFVVDACDRIRILGRGWPGRHLLAAGGRHDAIHARIYHGLAVMIEAVPTREGGNRYPGDFPTAKWRRNHVHGIGRCQ